MHLEPTKTLDSYQLIVSALTEDDIPRLHELSIGVKWPHRPEDWRMLLQLGEGIGARDEIGRLVSSAMWFPFGPEMATLGMFITAPRLQDHGAARWLMHHVLDRTKGRRKRLSATKAAYRLYLSMDFQPVATVFQHNGVVTTLPAAPGGARPATEADWPAIRALDSRAIGAPRDALLDLLLPQARATVLEDGGRVTGFALCRPFGRGYVIGPVVAESEEQVLAVIAPHVADHEGRFLRMDTRERAGPLRDYLEQSGMVLYDSVTTMERDGHGLVTEGARTFGLATQALG